MSVTDLSTIRDLLVLSDRLATAGQPTEAELGAVAARGYEVVINLALTTSPGALPDEVTDPGHLIRPAGEDLTVARACPAHHGSLTGGRGSWRRPARTGRSRR